VVTLGARGGLYLEGGRVRSYRARRVRVVDSTGAGDAFHGAFAAGLYLGLELRASLELAAHAAALNCTALGGMGRLMTRSELRGHLSARA
jgi:sulfofructose kinase